MDSMYRKENMSHVSGNILESRTATSGASGAVQTTIIWATWSLPDSYIVLPGL